MATQAERLDALENDNGILSAALEALTGTVSGLASRLEDLERIIKDGEALDELKASLAALAEHVEQLDLAGTPASGDLITAELVEGYDARTEMLKAFRQIEAISNHINVKLPA